MGLLRDDDAVGGGGGGGDIDVDAELSSFDCFVSMQLTAAPEAHNKITMNRSILWPRITTSVPVE